MCARSSNCLPVEIWYIITRSLHSSHDLNSLVKTNHSLFEIMNPILYRTFTREAMMLAARTGQVETAKLCMQYYPDLEPAILMSALTKAASLGHLSVIDVLWESSPGMSPRRAMEAACRHERIEVFGYLFDRQIEPPLRYMFKIAHTAGHRGTVKFILETASTRGKKMFRTRSILCPDCR